MRFSFRIEMILTFAFAILCVLILTSASLSLVAQTTLTNGVAQSGTLPPGGSVSYTFTVPTSSYWTGSFSPLASPMTTRTRITRASDGETLVSSSTNVWWSGGYYSPGDTYTVTISRTDTKSDTGFFTIANAIVPGPPPPQVDDQGGPMENEQQLSGSVSYGDVDVYWFNANASDPGLNVEIEGDSSARLNLVGPNGVVSDNCFRPNCYFYNNLAGTIYAVVSPMGTGTLSYTLTLHNSTAAPASQVGKSLGAQCAACQAAAERAGSTGMVAVGDPINPSSGNVFETVIDYTTTGQNPLSLVRYYNSAANLQSSPFAVSLGPNWRTNYDRYLHLVSPTLVTAERPDGRVLTFRLVSSLWKSDSDVDYRLTNSGSSWTLTDQNDVKETYAAISATEAQLDSIATAAGYVQTMSYDTNQLTTVTDSYSRKLGFTYSGVTLTGVTTPDALRLTYGFDTSGSHSRLKTVGYNTNPATSQTYLYEDTAFPFALTGITDENGARFTTWGYDGMGRGISSQLAGGVGATTVSYAADTFSTVVTGPLGLQETYKYKPLQDVSKIVEIDRHDPSGSVPDAVETLAYDANGYLNERVDWNGNKIYYTNNAYGHPLYIYEANGSAVARTTTISYDSTWVRKPSVVTLGIQRSAFTYDAATGNLTTKTLTDESSSRGTYAPSTEVWNYTYTATGQLHTVQSPRTDLAAITTYGYTSGTLTSITNPLGQITKITASTPGGRPTTMVDPNGVTTTLTYTPRNWLLTRSVATSGGVRTETFGYDRAGDVTSVEKPGGATVTETYDNAHRLTGIKDVLNQSEAYTLDTRGDVTASTIKNSSGTTTLSRSNTFDALGRRLTHTGGADQVTRFAYDKNSNLTSITDPLGHSTSQIFDALNRRSQITDRAAGITKRTYDSNDDLIGVVAPNGASTTYYFTGYRQVYYSSSPDSGAAYFYFDGDGNLVKSINALNITTTRAYDALDRRTSTTYPASATENVAYSYDQPGHGFGIGRLTGMTDQAGTFSRSYDERGNITSEGHSHGSSTLGSAYGYDAAGEVISQTYPDGMILTQIRDAMERVTGLSLKPSASGASQTVLSAISYEPFGPTAGFVYGNGIADTRAFDADYRLTNVTDKATTALQNLTYTLNANDNVTAITDAVTGANSQGLGYDTLDRLVTASGAYGKEAFGYDANGNRTSLNGVANTYLANSNRLTKIGTQTVTTNANGNITAIAYATPMGFTYNNANRLATVTSGNGTALSYLYDGFGQRVGKTDTIQRFEAYDQSGRFIEQTDNTITTKLDYIYLGSLPVATFVPNGGTGTLSFLHTDRLGTPRLATNAAKAIGWSATMADPFGAPNTDAGGNSIANDLRMPGQEFEAAAGFNHNGFRDYAPALGRYLETDPTGLAGGLNTYAYVSNRPNVLVDPYGLQDISPSDIPDKINQISTVNDQYKKALDSGAKASDNKSYDGFQQQQAAEDGDPQAVQTVANNYNNLSKNTSVSEANAVDTAKHICKAALAMFSSPAAAAIDEESQIEEGLGSHTTQNGASQQTPASSSQNTCSGNFTTSCSGEASSPR